MTDEQWIERLRQHKKGLSPAESKVARIVLANPALAMSQSITDLAELAGVGDATVSRLVRRLGFSSFHSFKIAIAQSLAPQTATRSPLIQSTASSPEWASDAATQAIESVTETLHLFDDTEFARAVTALVKADHIGFFGSGTSGSTAILAQQRMLSLGRVTTAYVDPHIQLMMAATMDETSTVVGISHSGANRDLYETLTIARKNRATVICVTATARSPITTLADVVLFAGGGTESLVSNLFHQMPLLFVLELLAQGCAKELGQVATLAEDRAADAISPRLF